MRFLHRLLFKGSRKAAALQAAIAEFGLTALACHEMKDLVRETRDVIIRVTACDEAGVFGYDPARRVAFPLDGVTWVAPDDVVAGDNDFARTVTNEPAPFIYDDSFVEHRADMSRFIQAGFRSGIMAVIGPHDAPLGVIAAHSRKPFRFGRRDSALMRLVANIAASVVSRLSVEADLRNARELVASAQDGIVTIDMEGVVTSVNPSAANMVGCSQEELLGRTSVELVIEEDRPRARTLFQATLNGERTKSDLRLRKKDGVQSWVSITGSPLTDACGHTAGAMAVISDVTDRVLAFEAMSLQKRQLNDAQAIAHVGSWEIDLDQRTVKLSDEIFRIVGCEPHSTPMSLDALAPLLPPGVPLETDALLERLAAHPEFDLVYEIARPDGEQRWVRSRGLREFHNMSGTRRIFGTTQDITTEKLTERAREEMSARLRSAASEWRETFDSIPSPVLIVDEALRVQRLNAAALNLSRFQLFADALMLRVDELGEAAVWKELAAVMGRRMGDGSFTARIDDADGKQWNVFGSRWKTGEQERTTIFTADVTELVRLEASLRRNERMNAVGALVAGVAHEVQNPLFGISAALDALEATGNGNMLARVMSSLRQQVVRLNELMHDLLEYGKPTTPLFRLDSVPLLLTKAAESMMPLAEKAGVELVVDAIEPLPPTLFDRHRMQQVIENLMKNAIQHSPRGSVVDVRAFADSAAVYIAVEDRGPGFTAAELPRVFEPFYTRRRGGTGLGLSLAQRIVEEHGGIVTASNRAGGGASMLVSLPIERGAVR